MKNKICTRCCQPIIKSGLKDPCLCRACEQKINENPNERFACFDQKIKIKEVPKW